MLTAGTDKRYTLLAVASGGLAAADGAQCRPLTPRRNSAQDRCDAAIRRAIQAEDRTVTPRGGVLATASLSAAAVVGVGTAGASGLGTAHPATLPAVTIGLISDGGGGSSIGTAALVEQGAKAAVAYQNEYGDGLEGHKINLYICENQSTPAGGETCANDMVQHRVVAVVEPFTGQDQTEAPTIAGAGIPYVAMIGASTAELRCRVPSPSTVASRPI